VSFSYPSSSKSNHKVRPLSWPVSVSELISSSHLLREYSTSCLPAGWNYEICFWSLFGNLWSYIIPSKDYILSHPKISEFTVANLKIHQIKETVLHGVTQVSIKNNIL
jgi:hypothetical protein